MCLPCDELLTIEHNYLRFGSYFLEAREENFTARSLIWVRRGLFSVRFDTRPHRKCGFSPPDVRHLDGVTSL